MSLSIKVPPPDVVSDHANTNPSSATPWRKCSFHDIVVSCSGLELFYFIIQVHGIAEIPLTCHQYMTSITPFTAIFQQDDYTQHSRLLLG